MFLVASIALSFVAQEPPSEPGGSLFYRDGLWAEGPGGLPRARLKGRWMHDWGDLDPHWRDDPGESDQTRRLRLLLQGELNPQLAFKTQDEFKGGDPSLLEWWLDWRIPAQPHVRVGHFREPFGLDARTSSAHLTFVDGGVMNNLTLGITWHLNSDTRWMVNHVRASSDEGRADLLLIRLHSGF